MDNQKPIDLKPLQLYAFNCPDTHETMFIVQARGVVQAITRSFDAEKRLGLKKTEDKLWVIDEIDNGGPYLAPLFPHEYFILSEPYKPTDTRFQ